MRRSTGRHVRETADPSPPAPRALRATLAAAAIAVAALLWAWSDGEAPEAAPGPMPAPAGTATAVAGAGVPTDPATGTTPPVRADQPEGPRWRELLRTLDHRRARAYAAGRPALLRRVYLPGSAVLAQDRATLAAYRVRGLRVADLRMRLLQVDVVDAGARRAVLDVVERLAPATAVDRSGRATLLVRDRPSDHRIVLRRTPAGWRIAAVQGGG